MVKVLLAETGKELDIVDGKITFVKQVADIANITDIGTSYSWALKFPKTPTNTIAFKGLGLVGDTSDVPYNRNRCHIVDNGITIVKNGLLIVKETGDDYKCHIQEGIIDFFQAVSSDKISDVIDLKELTHLNTVSNIIDSFAGNLPYKYIIANYNGPPMANVAGATNLNPLAMVPSINMKFLWDKIFEHYGWTYSGTFDLSERWMTYPEAKAYSDEDNIKVIDLSAQQMQYNTNNNENTRLIRWDVNLLDSAYIHGIIPNNWRETIIMLEPGNYRARFNIKGAFVFAFGQQMPFQSLLRVNLQDIPLASNISTEDEETVWDFIAYQNTVVQVVAINPTPYGGSLVVTGESYLTLETLGVQDVNFSEALIKFKVKDFFKEVMTRFALTSFADIDRKHIDFINIQERINGEVVDWSDRYVRRKKESYVYDNYAQRNYLKHKYNEEDADYADGILKVNNRNLPVEKTIYESIIFAPEEELVTYDRQDGTTYQVNNFKMFDVEVKEDPDTGDLIADYKALKNKFYVMQSTQANWLISILGTPVVGFPLAITTGNTYNDIANNQYAPMQKLLKDTRLHEIDLFLSKIDVANVDLKKVYYFEQEAGYYLLNKITWKNEQITTGEFIRIKK